MALWLVAAPRGRGCLRFVCCNDGMLALYRQLPAGEESGA